MRRGCQHCVPGELACEEAKQRIDAMRACLQRAVASGDWSEFDAHRRWLEDHLRPGEAAGEAPA